MADPILTAQDVDDFIIIRAVAFANKIQRMMTRDVLRRENVPLLEWRLLFSIARFGDCHVAMISERTSLDPAHASRAAAALEKKGLIIRVADPEDNRRRLMKLTPEGRALFDKIWPDASGLIRTITNELDPQEFETFKRLLDRVNAIAEPKLQASLTGKMGTSEKEARSAA